MRETQDAEAAFVAVVKPLVVSGKLDQLAAGEVRSIWNAALIYAAGHGEVARLRQALDAAFIQKDGDVYYRTANGIPQDVPKHIASLVRTALVREEKHDDLYERLRAVLEKDDDLYADSLLPGLGPNAISITLGRLEAENEALRAMLEKEK